jgi:hypothetical protein
MDDPTHTVADATFSPVLAIGGAIVVGAVGFLALRARTLAPGEAAPTADELRAKRLARYAAESSARGEQSSAAPDTTPPTHQPPNQPEPAPPLGKKGEAGSSTKSEKKGEAGSSTKSSPTRKERINPVTGLPFGVLPGRQSASGAASPSAMPAALGHATPEAAEHAAPVAPVESTSTSSDAARPNDAPDAASSPPNPEAAAHSGAILAAALLTAMTGEACAAEQMMCASRPPSDSAAEAEPRAVEAAAPAAQSQPVPEVQSAAAAACGAAVQLEAALAAWASRRLSSRGTAEPRAVHTLLEAVRKCEQQKGCAFDAVRRERLLQRIRMCGTSHRTYVSHMCTYTSHRARHHTRDGLTSLHVLAALVCCDAISSVVMRSRLM